ncbi:MAG TPA: IPT/TIG domain-containing protein [Ktedonobacteraceae bacterium]|nr:IPT/TIG domain-containing protein [Ktedonobacteraceae bacterium]
MNSEEYLDRMIEQGQRGEIWLPEDNQEVATCLVAAETLTRLYEINVPPEFARRLEINVRARARGFSQQHENVAALALPQSMVGTLRSQPLRPQRRRAWLSGLGVAAALALMFVGVLAVSASSLPGDLLYGIKQVENRLSLTFAGDPKDHAEIAISQLQNALVDLNSVVNEKRDDNTISMALDIVASNTSSSQQAVSALPAGPVREAAQHNLDSALAGEQQTLKLLMNRLDWQMQLAFTHQLGVLGATVPTITSAQVRIQSNGQLLITLTGAHFSPKAEFIFNGWQVGTISKITPTQLIAVINRSLWAGDSNALGLRNPDGTAAQTLYHVSDNDGDEQNSNQNSATPTGSGGRGTDSSDGGFDE